MDEFINPFELTVELLMNEVFESLVLPLIEYGGIYDCENLAAKNAELGFNRGVREGRNVVGHEIRRNVT